MNAKMQERSLDEMFVEVMRRVPSVRARRRRVGTAAGVLVLVAALGVGAAVAAVDVDGEARVAAVAGVGNGPGRPDVTPSGYGYELVDGQFRSFLDWKVSDADGFVREVEVDWADGSEPDRVTFDLGDCRRREPTAHVSDVPFTHVFAEGVRPAEYTLRAVSTDCDGAAKQERLLTMPSGPRLPGERFPVRIEVSWPAGAPVAEHPASTVNFVVRDRTGGSVSGFQVGAARTDPFVGGFPTGRYTIVGEEGWGCPPTAFDVQAASTLRIVCTDPAAGPTAPLLAAGAPLVDTPPVLFSAPDMLQAGEHRLSVEGTVDALSVMIRSEGGTGSGMSSRWDARAIMMAAGSPVPLRQDSDAGPTSLREPGAGPPTLDYIYGMTRGEAAVVTVSTSRGVVAVPAVPVPGAPGLRVFLVLGLLQAPSGARIPNVEVFDATGRLLTTRAHIEEWERGQATQPEPASALFDLNGLEREFMVGQRRRTAIADPSPVQYSLGESVELRTKEGDSIRVEVMKGDNLAIVGESPHVGPGEQTPTTVNSKPALLVRGPGGLGLSWVERDHVEFAISSPTADAAVLLYIAEHVMLTNA